MNVIVLRFVILFTVVAVNDGFVTFTAATLAAALIAWRFLRIISLASILSIGAV